jgi:hypothetical protein
MTCFRIDLDEADRAGNHPVMFDGKYIGVDPFASAAQWLSRYKRSGIQSIFDRPAGKSVITESPDFDDPQPPARDAEGDDPVPPDPAEDADEIADAAEKRRKRKQKKSLVPDDESESPPHDPRDEDAAYHARVNATVAAILAAHAVATGRAPAVPSPTGATRYARDLAVAVSRHTGKCGASNDQAPMRKWPPGFPSGPLPRRARPRHA